MRNVDSILKSRDIALLTKVCIIKAMVFPAVIYRCKSWTIKNAEPQRIDAFELWCWRRLLRVPSTARRSNQSILKEINPEIFLQYFGHWWEELTHWKRLWCWERLKTNEKRATEDEMVGWHHWPNGHEFEQTLGDGEEQRSLACCSPRGHKESDTT